MAFCFTGNEEQKQYLNLSELALATMEGDILDLLIISF